MGFYEKMKAEQIKESKKRRPVHSNREVGANKELFIRFSEFISQVIQDDLETDIVKKEFVYNEGVFGRKINCRYEKAVCVYFRYMHKCKFYEPSDIIAKGERILIHSDHYEPNWYYIATYYLSDTKYILFYILKNLKKDFDDIFIEASWGRTTEKIIDGLPMTRLLIESIVDKITTKVMRKAKNIDDEQFFEVCFWITVELNCDKNGNI